MHLFICIIASHLGTLDIRVDATCGYEARGVGAEPQDGVRWTSLEDGKEPGKTRPNGRKGPRP